MNYEFFLGKEEHRSYSLLKYLEESNSLSETYGELQEELAMSNFILKKTINQLQEDLAYYGLAEHLRLVPSDAYLQLVIDGKCSSKTLLSKYLSRSLSLQMMIAFFKREYHSTEEFAEEHHVSYSVAYKVLQQLKKKLVDYHIFLDKRQLAGNQININLFLSAVFLLADLPHRQIYSFRTVKTVKKVSKWLEAHYLLTEYEKQKLFHYLAVFVERDRKNRLSIDKEVTEVFTEKCLEQFSELSQYLSNSCIYAVICWLFLHGKLEKQLIDEKRNPELSQMNDRFLAQFEQQFHRLSEQISDEVYINLSRIHFGVLYYPMGLFEEFEMNIEFFKQNYPEFYYFLIQYLQKLIDERPELQVFQIFLFFNYLMLLINLVPLNLVNDALHVLVDFSYGEEYNQFIKKNLLFFANLNIEIVDSMEESDPDIVITNGSDLYDEEDMQVIIWLDPPRTIDWVNLTQSMLEIKKQKYNEFEDRKRG